ncbi:hypothetical protein AGDE_16141 [Angomonas deanei]|uniref:Uncharacterized protein n=1 Tax=Angomonas deanei TaxID=59799 RepID=A0A7G2CPY9_9TRYP|nr:hypothetical protein AGDE_16141 [Angomonas deanei]CAD2220613.1 hypothetical protein, conserved [Angomonas deanei]|eukprot:EPY17649.1 hypothetical protein AGDE_16141 [Angomonas deanei]
MELLEKRYNGEDIHAPRTPPASQNLSDSEERDTSAEADGKKFSSPKSASDSERADDSSSREEEDEAPATATALQEEESDNTGSGEEKKTSDGVNDIHKEHLAFYRKYDMSE